MVTLSLLDQLTKVDDRFDIEESFDALDVHHTGRLGFDRAYTLLLGLGYLDDYKRKDAFTCVELKESAKQIDDRDHEGLKLQTLQTIIATHPALSHKNNRSINFTQHAFRLIDRDQKGYITASDIQRLGTDVGKIDNDIREDVTISIDEANAMIETTNRMFQKNQESDNDGKNQKLKEPAFQKLLSSPSNTSQQYSIHNFQINSK